MKFIESKNSVTAETIQLSYEDYGEGKPVILIHGWPLSKEMWEYQLDALIDAGLRVITYDRRGFGKSDKPWTGYGYDSLTDDLRAIILHLNLQDVTLVGFSMGGGEVARYFTRYHGDRISKAVLISSVVPFMLKTEDNPEGVPEEMFTQFHQQINKDRIDFLDNFGKQFFGVNFISHPLSNALLDYYRMLAALASPKATKECMKSFGFTDFTNDAIAINVPTLIIHGDSDKTVPIDISSNKAAQLVPDNQYIVYSGAPHGLFYTERERLNNDLVTFITGGSVTTATTTDEEFVVLPSNDEGLITR